ncbi:hypothetical protein AKJ16_DCAP20368 [Drosera capensis]
MSECIRALCCTSKSRGICKNVVKLYCYSDLEWTSALMFDSCLYILAGIIGSVRNTEDQSVCWYYIARDEFQASLNCGKCT